jgi:hypothetical protein
MTWEFEKNEGLTPATARIIHIRRAVESANDRIDTSMCERVNTSDFHNGLPMS